MENIINITRSESQSKVLAALISARGKFVKVKKDRTNTHLKNKYATLDSVLDAINPALTDNDLIVEQSMLPGSTAEVMHIVTELIHSSGEYRCYYFTIPIAKRDAQGVGSAFTYARRYALCGIFGLSQADDDAQIAVKSAADWKKDLDKCETTEELQATLKSAWVSSDAASKKIIQDHYEKRKAEITIGKAKGFKPNKPQAVAQPVDNEAKDDVKSKPEAQDISQF